MVDPEMQDVGQRWVPENMKDPPENREKLDQIRTEAEVSTCFHELSFEEAKELAEAIQGNPLLRALNLTLCGLVRDGDVARVESLASGLKGSGVICLDLSINNLGDQGLSALASVLGETALQDLALCQNEIGAKGVCALAEHLKASRVTALNLCSNELEDEAAKALASVLRESRIQSLDLSYNNICALGAQALAEGLRSSRVTSLDLGSNTLTDFGAVALAAVLRESSVESLNLSLTKMGVEGACALAQGLQSSSVTSLDLFANSVLDAGARAFAAVLRETFVLSLNLSSNEIGREGAEALLETLRNSPVIELEISGIPEETRREMDEVLKSNKARSFVLQTEAQASEHEIRLNFRTLAGAVAASLTWPAERPAQELPKVVLTAMQSSGFQLPFRGLSAMHLKLVRPDGALVDVEPTALSLAKQLGRASGSQGANAGP